MPFSFRSALSYQNRAFAPVISGSLIASVFFSIGASGGDSVVLIKDGTVSGWLTMETAGDAKASCTSGNY